MQTLSEPDAEPNAGSAAGALKIVECMPGYGWSADADGRLTCLSGSALTYLGEPAENDEPSGGEDEFGWRRLVHPDDYDRVVVAWRRCLQSGEHYDTEHRLRRADGAYRWFRVSGRPARDGHGNITGWYGTAIDIDELQQALLALRARERDFSQLVNMVPSLLWRLSPDGKPIFFSNRMIDFLGFDVTDCNEAGACRSGGAAIAALVHPDDAVALEEALDRCLATSEHWSMRYRMRRADGVYRWMSGHADPTRDESGRIIQWYGLAYDIDDHVHAEAALRYSQRRLQQMIDAVPVRIWSGMPTGGPIYFNKRYQDYLRSVIDDFDNLRDPQIEEFVRTLIHPADAPDVLRTLQKSFETGGSSVMRFRWREKDGSYRWAECRVEPHRDADGAIVQWYGVSLDIDDEMRAQEALREASEKLAHAAQAASLAELTASIAHEVNQPLAAIVANSYACRQWLESKPPNLERAQSTAEAIIRNANSAAEVVGRVRALFRQTVQARRYLTLGPVVAEVCELVADLAARNRVEIETHVDDCIPPVPFDRVQVQQVLVNLMRNAVEAMAATAGERTLRVGVRRGGDVVQIEVADTGPGVAESNKVFDAFFTTKESGMGMGLAISRTIVESHGGRLWVEPNEGRGATFVFTLPIERPDG